LRTAMNDDPRLAIREGSMTSFQVLVVVICVVLNMVDGFDVLAMSFTAPLIAREWGVDPATLGVLLSAGLVGMGAGALFISPIADVIGRRAVVILSTVIMSVGMFASAATTGVLELWLCRFATGLGIGGVLASGNTLLAEYAPNRWRDLVISTMVIGYPVGAIIGGSIFAVLVSLYGWRSAFVFGGLASTVLVPLIVLYLPESLDFILSRRRANTLGQVNAVLRRLGRPPLTTLPDMPREETDTKAIIGVFEPRFLKSTLLMVLSFFMLMFSFYFVLSWTPKNLVDLGFTVEQGIFALVLLNLGGIFGGLAFGYLAGRSGARTLASYMLFALFFVIVGFGMLQSGWIAMMAAAFVVGFFLMGSMAGLYIIVPHVYPPQVRNTGTGLAIGIGRVGAMVGPYLAGLLIAAGWDRIAYYSMLALPVLISALAVRYITHFDERPMPAGDKAHWPPKQPGLHAAD
jgi:benzoate transport